MRKYMVFTINKIKYASGEVAYSYTNNQMFFRRTPKISMTIISKVS